jgi:hypothetical protein
MSNRCLKSSNSTIDKMKQKPDLSGPESPHFNLPAVAEDAEQEVAAWEEVEEGRFMPKRVRGSCQGRALG